MSILDRQTRQTGVSCMSQAMTPGILGSGLQVFVVITGENGC